MQDMLRETVCRAIAELVEHALNIHIFPGLLLFGQSVLAQLLALLLEGQELFLDVTLVVQPKIRDRLAKARKVCLRRLQARTPTDLQATILAEGENAELRRLETAF